MLQEIVDTPPNSNSIRNSTSSMGASGDINCSRENINVVVHSENNNTGETKYNIPRGERDIICYQRVGANYDPSIPPIVTYHDLGLNHTTCFGPFFDHPKMKTILPYLNIIQIEAPGHELNAATIATSDYPSIQEMSEDVQFVLEYFKIKNGIIGIGAGAGGCVLTSYAITHQKNIVGLVLIGSVIKSFSWLDWVKSWIELSTLPSLKNSTGVRNYLLNHYYADNLEETNPQLLDSIKKEMLMINQENLHHYVHAFVKREDVKSEKIKELSFKILLIVGKDTSYKEDIMDLFSHFNPRNSTIVQVPDCGILVTAEKPNYLIEPFKLYMQGLGYLLDYYQSINDGQE
ncbi:NDR family protein [Tieghemostelium lacteum]|uniref:NDR family protein n=1 Tax=Tieghemostelium lacteum TaxID=361077 RepID=A0A152A8Y0_TIELA|nr:NDR family protein [Tieghemostelium lacteum]|eukprot:KYR02527.1 NDR family protein [Tieghemostelium lacteum]